jgi:hypothetical protein
MLKKHPQKQQKVIFTYLEDSLQNIFGEELYCLLVHGSIVKGGMIEGFSDLDVQVFLQPNSFNDFGLKLEKAMELQELVGDLNIQEIGAAYLQILFINIQDIPDWYTPPIKGTYKILFGQLPENLNYSMKDFQVKIKKSLLELPSVIENLIRNFADSSNEQISRRTRYVATKVFPIMYSLLSYDIDHPDKIWSQDKLTICNLFQKRYANQQISEMLTQFFSCIRKIPDDKTDLELLKQAFSVGIDFLIEATKIASKELKN